MRGSLKKLKTITSRTLENLDTRELARCLSITGVALSQQPSRRPVVWRCTRETNYMQVQPLSKKSKTL